MTEEIQDDEQPGSEIELGIGGGSGARIERESGAPVSASRRASARALALERSSTLPDDPDTPIAGDPVDDALPGEGPEDLSGPEDEDDLPGIAAVSGGCRRRLASVQQRRRFGRLATLPPRGRNPQAKRQTSLHAVSMP